MKIVFYLLTIICGLFGLVALARFGEALIFGGRLSPIQLVFAVVGLVLAGLALKKARSS